jgi:AraC-like DNA-binding protein
VAYREHAPPPALAHLVAAVWRDGGEPAGQAKLILPDGCADLIWWAGELVVAGPDTRPQPSALGPGETVAGVRFRTGAAGAVLGVPLDAVADARVPLAELWGREATDRLAEAAAGNPDALLAGLAERLRRAAPDPRVRLAVARLRDDPNARPRALAEATGLGERHLRRRFRDAVGYSPRTFGRVVRARRALALLRAGGAPAAVALDAGYADQAHLTRELRALAGKTPGAVRGVRA